MVGSLEQARDEADLAELQIEGSSVRKRFRCSIGSEQHRVIDADREAVAHHGAVIESHAINDVQRLRVQPSNLRRMMFNNGHHFHGSNVLLGFVRLRGSRAT